MFLRVITNWFLIIIAIATDVNDSFSFVGLKNKALILNYLN